MDGALIAFVASAIVFALYALLPYFTAVEARLSTLLLGVAGELLALGLALWVHDIA